MSHDGATTPLPVAYLWPSRFLRWTRLFGIIVDTPVGFVVSFLGRGRGTRGGEWWGMGSTNHGRDATLLIKIGMFCRVYMFIDGRSKACVLPLLANAAQYIKC